MAPPFISDSSRNRGTVPESPQRTGDCPAAMPDREGNVMSYENIIVEKEAGVGIITLNRPKALNALCKALIADLEAALDDLESDDGIGCILLTGSEKAFAAGAHIKEMKEHKQKEAHAKQHN